MFGRAVEKYGWDNICHEIAKSGLSRKEAMEMERQLIDQYNTHDPRFGYNLTDGGEGKCGYIVSKETKEKMSANRQGTQAHRYGKPMSDQAKEIVSKKLTGRDVSQKSRDIMSQKKKKPVFQYDLSGNFIASFESATAASETNGINRGNICACCRHIVKQAGGFFWSYDRIDDVQIIKRHLSGEEPLSPIQARNTKAVIQMDHHDAILNTFASIKEASQSSGYTAQQIIHCCMNPNAVSGPYKWRYKDG